MVVRSEASWNASRSPLATTRGPAARLLGGNGGGEEVVGLVARRLRIREAARGDELRQHLELLDQLVDRTARPL